MRFVALFMLALMGKAALFCNHYSLFHSKERMAAEVDILCNVAEASYALKEWKEDQYGWCLEGAAKTAKERIMTYPGEKVPLKEFQKILRSFFNSFRDYHVGITFYSTEKATLPLHIKELEGKYYIVHIDRQQLSEGECPFHVGDQVLLFDDIPIEEYMKTLRINGFEGDQKATDQGLLEMLLTARSGRRGDIVPQGPLTVTVLSRELERPTAYQLIWDYRPERLQRHCSGNPTPELDSPDEALNELFTLRMTLPLFTADEAPLKPCYKANKFEMGGRYSYIPTLGEVVWENGEESTFSAYLFKLTDKRQGGYLRIPHYHGGVRELEEFAAIVALFEQEADIVVVDQTNNPGGFVFFLYALASMLADHPLATPKHRMSINYREAAMALTLIPLFESIHNDSDAQMLFDHFEYSEDFLLGRPATHQMVKFFLNHLYFILEQWQAGRTLSDPIHLCGIDKINPHPKVRLTKPILLLTNSMDFSGGDFFPAILQDNGRATIMGERTGGAGGAVFRTSHSNPFGIRDYHFTMTLALRPDNTQIEDQGVIPDIPYSLTLKDLLEEGVELKEKILSTLDLLLSH